MSIKEQLLQQQRYNDQISGKAPKEQAPQPKPRRKAKE